MRVTTSKSHSSTCGWSPRAYRQLVANQFPYIQPISINWPLISSKGDARGRFSLASERARAVSRACNTRSRARERREGIRFVLSRAFWHSIHRVGKTQPRYPFVSRGLIHGIDVISDYLNDGWGRLRRMVWRELFQSRSDGITHQHVRVNERYLSWAGNFSMTSGRVINISGDLFRRFDE